MRILAFSGKAVLLAGFAVLSLSACGKSDEAGSKTDSAVDAPSGDMSLDASTSDAMIDEIAGATDPAPATGDAPAEASPEAAPAPANADAAATTAPAAAPAQ